MTESDLFETIKTLGLGNPKRLIHTATVLHKDWEMDNEIWLVRMEDDSIQIFTTTHGGFFRTNLEQIEAAISETEASLLSLMTARGIVVSSGR